MTDLTEQWKNGELPEGDYFITDGDKIYPDYFDNAEGFLKTYNYRVQKVLAPVPSYDRFCRLNHLENDFIKAHERINELKKENQHLKELLRECRKALNKAKGDTVWYPVEIDNVLTQIDNAIGEKK